MTLQAWKLTLVVRLVINCQLGVLGPVGLTIRAGQFPPTGGHRGWLGRPLEGRRIQRPCSQTMGLAAAGGVTRGRERTTLTIARSAAVASPESAPVDGVQAAGVGEDLAGGCPSTVRCWVLLPAGDPVDGQWVPQPVGDDHPRAGGHPPEPADGGPHLECVIEQVRAQVITGERFRLGGRAAGSQAHSHHRYVDLGR